MLKLCVFDCDGTLVDGLASISACMDEAFATCGLAVPPADAVKRVIGLSLADAILRLLPAGDRALAARLAAAYTLAFGDRRRRGAVEDPLYPGVLAALDNLDAAGWLLGIATGKSSAGAQATLAGHGLGSRFVTLQTADVAAAKPAPEMLLRAMAETGARPEGTVMVGDTCYDMEMARSARVGAIGVAWGYHDAGELEAAGADVVVSSFAEIPAAAGRLVAGAALR